MVILLSLKKPGHYDYKIILVVFTAIKSVMWVLQLQNRSCGLYDYKFILVVTAVQL